MSTNTTPPSAPPPPHQFPSTQDASGRRREDAHLDEVERQTREFIAYYRQHPAHLFAARTQSFVEGVALVFQQLDSLRSRRPKPRTNPTFSIEQSQALMQEYLTTLDDDEKMDEYLTSRDFANRELEAFLEWLRKRMEGIARDERSKANQD